MNRSTALVVALFGLGLSLPAGTAVAGLTPNDQLVGTSTLVSRDQVKSDRTKLLPLAGINPNGVSHRGIVVHVERSTSDAVLAGARPKSGPQSERSFEVAQRRCPNGRC
jgi:hypothetical protein